MTKLYFLYWILYICFIVRLSILLIQLIVSIDAGALYTNLQRKDAVNAVNDALEQRDDKSVPTDFLVKLLDLVLKFNLFEFEDNLY